MMNQAIAPFIVLVLACQAVHAFERVECMDRPDGSVYIFKRVADRPGDLDVRIYHGWQYGRYNLPGLPIGVEQDFLNARYDVRTAGERQAAIAAFTPLERLIFDMDVVFDHRFRDCELSDTHVRCHAGAPTKIGSEWISGLEFFFDARSSDRFGADAVFTVGIRGESTWGGVEFSSGRQYYRYGRFSQCLYLDTAHWQAAGGTPATTASVLTRRTAGPVRPERTPPR